MELYDEKVVWLHKWGQFFIVPQFFGKMKVLTSGLINVIPSGKRIRQVWLWIFYKSWKAISFLYTSWFSRRGEKQIPAMRGRASSDRNSFSLQLLNHGLGNCNWIEWQVGNLTSLPILLRGFALYFGEWKL